MTDRHRHKNRYIRQSLGRHGFRLMQQKTEDMRTEGHELDGTHFWLDDSKQMCLGFFP